MTAQKDPASGSLGMETGGGTRVGRGDGVGDVGKGRGADGAAVALGMGKETMFGHTVAFGGVGHGAPTGGFEHTYLISMGTMIPSVATERRR